MDSRSFQSLLVVYNMQKIEIKDFWIIFGRSKHLPSGTLAQVKKLWINSDDYIIKFQYYGLKLNIFWPLTFLLLFVNPLRPLLRETSGGGEIPSPQGTTVI